MKKIVLKLLLFITISSFIVYACTSENETNDQLTTSLKSMPEREGVIAKIVDDEAVPLYDEFELRDVLVAEGIFVDVESIDLVYGYNPETDEYESFLTIIAQEEVDSSIVSVAIVADLIIDGGDLIIEDPEIQPIAFAKHTCAGAPCSSCSYTRGGFLGLKITGCQCNEGIEGARCNHTISSGGVVKEVVTIVKDAAL